MTAPPAVRFGRYEVLEPIAGGGMGVVYAAHDPELERRVAIKVVHPDRSEDAASRSRLLREARALARLDHPNIVKVHDVLADDDQIVVVMELVAGQTLSEWERAAARSWQDIAAAYVQAGKGLVAAHALGIVHRDFKPSNAIIGDDRRVRVLDFGIARYAIAGDAVADADGSPGSSAETTKGALLGTPAYAAPEQLAGGVVTAASDQFSFCVSLHRALEGKPPFDGAGIAERVANIRAGEPALATDGRQVPAWLRALVRRGLAFDPKARHASMAALVAALERPRGWKRWRAPSLVAVLVAAAAFAAFELRPAKTEPSCDAGARDAANVWSGAARDQVAGALDGIGTPYAHDTAARVVGQLDARVRDWTLASHDTCAAHQHGGTSDALFDRQVACLSQRLDDVRSAIAVLDGTTAGTLDHAAEVVADLPAFGDCTNAALVASGPQLPGSPLARAQVAAARASIGRAAALRHAGRFDEAAAAVKIAVAAASATDYTPVIAEATLEHGRIALQQDAFGEASPVLLDAMSLGLTNNLPALAVEAAARHIYVEARLEHLTIPELITELRYIDPLSQSLVADHFARPLLLNNVGVAYKAAGDDADAMRYFAQARDLIAAIPDPDLELIAIPQNIAMLTADPTVRTAVLRDVVSRMTRALGEQALPTLEARFSLASLEADPRRALEDTRALCDQLKEHGSAAGDMYVSCELLQGYLAASLGDRTTAERAYANLTRAPGQQIWTQLGGGMLSALRGDQVAASKQLHEVMAANIRSSNWWERLAGSLAELQLGVVQRNRDYVKEAVDGITGTTGCQQWIVCTVALEQGRAALTTMTQGDTQ